MKRTVTRSRTPYGTVLYTINHIERMRRISPAARLIALRIIDHTVLYCTVRTGRETRDESTGYRRTVRDYHYAI